MWTAEQLAHFLEHTAHLRLHAALHVAATTGMRRGRDRRTPLGRLESLYASPLDRASRQSISGRSIEIPTKTSSSRRCIDLDTTMETSSPTGVDVNEPMPSRPAQADAGSTNTCGESIHPESLTQLFDRQVARLGLPVSASTTSATPMLRCSSQSAHRSRSCPSASATLTPASRWPPISTCYPAWAPTQLAIRPHALRGSVDVYRAGHTTAQVTALRSGRNPRPPRPPTSHVRQPRRRLGPTAPSISPNATPNQRVRLRPAVVVSRQPGQTVTGTPTLATDSRWRPAQHRVHYLANIR